MAEFDANVKVLDDTIEKQNQTKDVLTRIQRKVAEAEGLGEQTYEELRRQGQQMVRLLLFFFKQTILSL